MNTTQMRALTFLEKHYREDLLTILDDLSVNKPILSNRPNVKATLTRVIGALAHHHVAGGVMMMRCAELTPRPQIMKPGHALTIITMMCNNGLCPTDLPIEERLPAEEKAWRNLLVAAGLQQDPGELATARRMHLTRECAGEFPGEICDFCASHHPAGRIIEDSRGMANANLYKSL